MPPRREIEVKLRVSGVAETVDRLRQIGAKKVVRVFESNVLFDTEDEHFRRRFAILRIRQAVQADMGLRRLLDRRERPPAKKRVRTGILTFKGLVAGQGGQCGRYKEREEIEFRLKDAGRFAKLLRRIGMRPWFRYEKYRTRYATSYPGLWIDLDETPVGVFLELEGPRRSIDRAARALGYSSADYITASYLELYTAECFRKSRKPGNMLFESKKITNMCTLRLTKFASTLNK